MAPWVPPSIYEAPQVHLSTVTVKSHMKIRSIVEAAVLVAVISLLLIFVGAPQQTWRTWRIYKDTGTTVGVITNLDCNNHGKLSYSFEVDGIHFLGGSPNFHGECRKLKNGQRVLIHFEQGAPATNLATIDDRRGRDATSMLRNELLASLVIVVLPMLILAAYLLGRKLLNRRNSTK